MRPFQALPHLMHLVLHCEKLKTPELQSSSVVQASNSSMHCRRLYRNAQGAFVFDNTDHDTPASSMPLHLYVLPRRRPPQPRRRRLPPAQVQAAGYDDVATTSSHSLARRRRQSYPQPYPTTRTITLSSSLVRRCDDDVPGLTPRL